MPVNGDNRGMGGGYDGRGLLQIVEKSRDWWSEEIKQKN